MPVEDVFSITGRGTVATGRVERGSLTVGTEVEIIGLTEEKRKVVVTGIEMFRKLLDEAETGDNIGALLRGVQRDEIERGQVLAAPGTIHPHTKFKGEVYVPVSYTHLEELFEARKPKGLAVICEADGTVVSIEPTMDNKTKVKVRGEEERVYEIPYGARICVSEGEYVLAGDNITRGPLDPKDILRLNGVEGVYQYLLKEVQRVYKQQGVDINDKHVEVIVSQMLSKLKVNDPGDTELLPGGCLLYTSRCV